MLEEYTKRHEELKANNNKRIILVAIPAVLYFMTDNPIYIILGIIYLGAILYYARQQKKKIFAEYTVIEKQRLEELNADLTGMGIPENRLMTFGYRRTETAFAPVLLCRCENELYLLDNVLIKNYIYGVDGKMVYLPAINKDAFKKPMETYMMHSLFWQVAEMKHQELLRTEGLRLNTFIIIENFIYAQLLKEMQENTIKKSLNTTVLLTKMKKETVYEVRLKDDVQLFLPKENAAILHLEIGSEAK